MDSAATMTEREKLVALHNLWIRRAEEARDPMERTVLNVCVRELREALYGR